MLNWFIEYFKSTMSFYFSVHSVNFLDFDIETPTKKNLIYLLKKIVVYSGPICTFALYLPYLL